MNIFQRQLDAKMASSLEENLVKFSNKITNLTGIPAYKADEYGFTINTKHFEIKPMGYMWVNFFKDQSSSHDPNSSASHANAIAEVLEIVERSEKIIKGWQEKEHKEPIHPRMDKQLKGIQNKTVEITCNTDGDHTISGMTTINSSYMINLDKAGWDDLCGAIEDLKKFHVDKNI